MINSMDAAPRDGSRILLHFTVYHFSDIKCRFNAAGNKWEECLWSEPRRCWITWEGERGTGQTIDDRDALGWVAVPKDEPAKEKTKTRTRSPIK